MLYGDEALFSLVRSARLGNETLSPVLAELREWLEDEFDVSVVHIVFDHVELGPATGRPRLNVILETDADYDSWKSDVVTIRPEIKRRVLSRFKQIAQADSKTYDTDEIFLILDNFSDECLGQACSSFLKRDADQIARTFTDLPIWKFDGHSRYLVVFLETEEAIQTGTDNGACARLRELCLDTVRQYDEFGYLTEETFWLKFDSRELLDRNYNGSLFAYWR